jgi:cytochrome d ubiquinol oxidase subunit I
MTKLVRAELVDFGGAVFNPSTLVRYFHTVYAALISVAFFMAGVSAYLILKNKDTELMKKS